MPSPAGRASLPKLHFFVYRILILTHPQSEFFLPCNIFVADKCLVLFGVESRLSESLSSSSSSSPTSAFLAEGTFCLWLGLLKILVLCIADCAVARLTGFAASSTCTATRARCLPFFVMPCVVAEQPFLGLKYYTRLLSLSILQQERRLMHIFSKFLGNVLLATVYFLRH